MNAAAEREQYELAAKYRDLISTVELLEQKQRMHAVDGDDADVFGYHYENQMLAVNLFHMRGGKIMDKREFFWEDMQRDRRRRRLQSGRVLLGAAEAGLSRPAVHSAQRLRSGGFRRPRHAGGSALRGPEPQGADSRSAARRQALAGRSGRTERQAGLRSALPRDEADGQGDPGSPAGRAHAAGAAEAHRVLRHLAHPGRGDGRVDGGVGRRQDEEVGLPQVHHQDGRSAWTTSPRCARW